jgi:thioredoxin 1
MSDDLVKHITDHSFDKEVLQSDVPVLVDFWAPWCGPCKALAPIIDETAPEYRGRLVFVKLNVDDNAETPAQHGIRGIPALMIVKDGEVVGTNVGLLSKKELKLFIDKHI